MHEFLLFHCQTIPLPDDYPVEEKDLAQSRQGAKEEENELREPILCVSAPWREILLGLPEVICRRALRLSQRERCEDYGHPELLAAEFFACCIGPVLAE
ncbi:MAG: hypothetical protein NTW21_05825 [Verrucomicrobia bacterium]|nr:hypothetical protein [Verrucomicrobiota bacterium]